MGADIQKKVIEYIARVEGGLSKENLEMDNLMQHYAPNLHYHDPFHDVTGLENLRIMYSNVLEKFEEFNTTVTGHAVSGTTAFLSFQNSNTYKKKHDETEGMIRLEYDENGLIKDEFIVYDASVAFESIPMLGWFIRKIRKHLSKTFEKEH